MRPKRYIAAVAALGLSLASLSLMNHRALAFEETTVGGSAPKAPAAQVLELPKLPKDLPKDATDPGKGLGEPAKGLSLTTPEIQFQGTEVRIPGLGTVGVLPKLDFGLELLYGASEPKEPFTDKGSPDDVQLRGTIKHRF